MSDNLIMIEPSGDAALHRFPSSKTCNSFVRRYAVETKRQYGKRWTSIKDCIHDVIVTIKHACFSLFSKVVIRSR